MSAIDKLKAKLTRLGVEYDFTDRLREVPSYQSVTWWYNTADKARFFEYHDGSTQLIVRNIKSGVTPEQAIAATLGMGVNCSKAEHDAGGCLGFQSGDDDEPVDQCKACHKYTSYEVEL